MPTEPTNTQAQHSQKIAVLETQMQFMRESLVRIESNHLVHINDELRRINESIGSLKITDAAREPGANLFWDVIKLVIMAIVSAGVAIIVKLGAQ